MAAAPPSPSDGGSALPRGRVLPRLPSLQLPRRAGRSALYPLPSALRLPRSLALRHRAGHSLAFFSDESRGHLGLDSSALMR